MQYFYFSPKSSSDIYRSLAYYHQPSVCRLLGLVITFCAMAFAVATLIFMIESPWLRIQPVSQADLCRVVNAHPDSAVGRLEQNSLPNPFYLHYIRFKPDNGTMEFRFIDYLSVMSGVQYLKPDGIILHGDFEPEDKYWTELKSKGLIRHMYRQKVTNAGQRLGKPKVVAHVQHAADMAKLDVLLEYGGVAVDFDVFFVRGERVREILTRKKALLCFGDEDGYNIGFVGARKDSKLLYAWRQSYKDIYVKDWNFNQAFVAKYLAILFREETYVADRICNNPHPDRGLDRYFRDYGIINWKDSIAIHTYERFGHVPIRNPADLAGNLTSHKELLRTIYRNLTLPPADAALKEEIDPLTSKLV